MSKVQFPSDDSGGRIGPWPGPLPYREGDPHYRGRARDLDLVWKRIRTDRLTLITGNSGVGKTSFLGAAVIPRLRMERALTIANYKDRKACPAVLVVRDWLPKGLKDYQSEHRDYNGILKDAIRSSITVLQSAIIKGEIHRGEQWADVRDSVLKDCGIMLEADMCGTAYDYATRLAEKAGSLLLCMDQFEEVLLRSAEQREGMLDTVADLVNQRTFKISIALSFRQEFLHLFNRLDRRVGELVKATAYLEEMPENSVRAALKESAQSADSEITDKAIDKVLEWMREAKGVYKSDGIVPGSLTWESLTSSASVDLLRLQALLYELDRSASENRKSDERVKITEKTVNDLLRQVQSEYPGLTGDESGLEGSGLASLALHLFIDRRVVPLPLVQISEDPDQWTRLAAEGGLPSDLSPEDEGKLHTLLQQRRIAARMGPFFSSLGLKVPQYEANLVAAALRDDWDTLEIEVKHIRGLLKTCALEGAIQSAGGLDLSDEEINSDRGILSGWALRGRGWTQRYALRQLLDASLETLKRLEKFNILRSKTAPEGIVYELVHDGFGPALFDWSERTRSDPLDALGAMIAPAGRTFRWTRLAGRVEHVCWRGCILAPADEARVLEFNDVRWVNCDLRGTIFRRCRFGGGSFENCDLGGVLFIDCEFAGSSDTGQQFTFHGVRANGLTIMGGSLTDVVFLDCDELHRMLWCKDFDGQQLTMSNVVLKKCKGLRQWSVEASSLVSLGPLSLQECGLQLCDLLGLTSDVYEDESGIDVRGCEFDYCLLGEDLIGLILEPERKNEVRP